MYLALEVRLDQIIEQEQAAQHLTEIRTALVDRHALGGTSVPFDDCRRRTVAGLERGDHMQEAVPALARHAARCDALNPGLELFGNPDGCWQIQFPAGEIGKPRRQVKAQQLGRRQGEVRKPVSVDGQSLQIGYLLF